MQTREPGLAESLTRFQTEVWSGTAGLLATPTAGPAAILIMRAVNESFTLLETYATADALETAASLRAVMRHDTQLGMLVIKRDSFDEARMAAQHFAQFGRSRLTDGEAELLLAHSIFQAVGGPRAVSVNHSVTAIDMGLATMPECGSLEVTPLGRAWLAGNFSQGQRAR